MKIHEICKDIKRFNHSITRIVNYHCKKQLSCKECKIKESRDTCNIMKMLEHNILAIDNIHYVEVTDKERDIAMEIAKTCIGDLVTPEDCKKCKFSNNNNRLGFEPYDCNMMPFNNCVWEHVLFLREEQNREGSCRVNETL